MMKRCLGAGAGAAAQMQLREGDNVPWLRERFLPKTRTSGLRGSGSAQVLRPKRPILSTAQEVSRLGSTYRHHFALRNWKVIDSYGETLLTGPAKFESAMARFNA
jgi:hypothetical protein